MSGLADNERGELFPISYSQNNNCGLERICPGTPINNICSVLRINGRIDPALIGRCLNTVLRADSSLRLTLTLRDGQPVQYCRPYEPQSFPFFDFTLTDAGGIARWENAGAQLALPWLDSPLYAFSVFKSGENSGGILLKLHHLIADGERPLLYEDGGDRPPPAVELRLDDHPAGGLVGVGPQLHDLRLKSSGLG